MPSRLILHKFDPLTPAPGGIDTCIRGIIKYSDPSEELLIVGVLGSGADSERTLGVWEDHVIGDRQFRFLPVTDLDPGNQIRRVPHAVRIASGLARFKRRVPRVTTLQTHRADLALVGPSLITSETHDYFVHTQESGILGKESDSFWKRAGGMHRAIERRVVRRASRVRVFNPTYAPLVKAWNANTKFSPTWWDPSLVPPKQPKTSRSIVWVGRLEQPKVPSLAVATVRRLHEIDPASQWKLRMIGAGNLFESLKGEIAALSLEGSVELVGRRSPEGVMDEMSAASHLLMTSVEGYEGYPRVLVEGLANGLLAVVTKGADTGQLVENGVNGFRVEPDDHALARALIAAGELSDDAARASVEKLSAPEVVANLYA